MTNPTHKRKSRSWPSITGHAEERASRALSRLEDISRLISEWVWECDQEGRLTFVSERIFEQLGVVSQAIIGKRFSDIGVFTDANGTPIEPTWDRPFRELLFVAQDVNGRSRQFLVGGVPFFHPDTWAFEGVSGTARDVTDIRQAEIAKREFIAVVNHELRTPLTSVRGALELLNSGVVGALPEKASRMLDIATRNSDRLVTLINDILDIERLELDTLNFSIEPVDTGALMIRAMEDIHPHAEDIDISLEMIENAKNAIVDADPGRLLQVLTNLLSNAVKFSPKGQTVSLGVRRSADLVRLYVRDHGPGIPKKDRETIFQKFTQADSSTTREVGGTGLGLAISKSIVERLGGNIWFDSNENEETTFYVDLPPCAE